MLKFPLSVVFLGLNAIVVSAQTGGFFRPVPAETLAARPADVSRPAPLPQQFSAYRLDLPGLRSALAAAPAEHTDAARRQSCRVELPSADGTGETYAVWSVEMMEPALAERHPEVRTYAGESLRQPGKFVRMSLTARGFRAMVMHPDFNVEYLEPYDWARPEEVIAYDRRQLPSDPHARLARELLGGGAAAFSPQEPYTPPSGERGVALAPVKLRVYRFVVATTGEFGQDHGGTVASVFSAVVEYTNLVSAIFERDINLRLQLQAQSEAVMFVSPFSDPFTGEEVTDWMSQNESVLNQHLPDPAAYDLAHVYARYISGGAIGVSGGLGIACSSNKSRGCSGGNGQGNYGDGFIAVICQEVGHQMGGGHTWNRCGNIGGRHANTAFEPGSGSTLLGYAGACGSDNVQGSPNLYFHAGSIEEIKRFYTQGFGSTCGTWLQTANQSPTVTLPYADNFFIPKQTPFLLTGSADDPDGDALSYSWEQIDLGPETPLESPAGNAPLFRSRPAVNEPTRYFPRFSTVLGNDFDPTEQLPDNTRDMTFRLTTRDNRPDGGGVGWADVAFKATAEAGPFRVTYPNTAAAVWQVGEFVAVQWDVANTNAAPVNCQKVDIRLSTDGGFTYPILLAAGVANDGANFVLAPDAVTGQARIRIEAADNVFYDLSDAAFSIEPPAAPGFSLGLSTDAAGVCLPGVFTATVLTAGVLGFNTPATLALDGDLPPGATAALSATTLNPGETAELTVDLTGVTVEGTFTFNLVATVAGLAPLVRPITLTLTSNDFSLLTLDAPADGATGLGLNQTLYWALVPDAESYDIELASSPSFAPATILATKTATTLGFFKVPFLLETNRGYYWRVRPRNECGQHAWSAPSFFSTYSENCTVYSAGGLPLVISADNMPTVEATVAVGSTLPVSDINVTQIHGDHTRFSNLEGHLISPQGTDVLLFKNKCGAFNGTFNLSLDDAALSPFACPPVAATAVKAQTSFQPLLGQPAAGIWTLRLKDNVAQDGGSLTAFQLEICGQAVVEAPYLVNNLPLSVEWGSSQAVAADLLLVEDADNTPEELLFTLVSVPAQGMLQKNFGGALLSGDQFTQADINAGAIRYFHDGATDGPLTFTFTVTDGAGGFLGTPQFVIGTVPVGTAEAVPASASFRLYPNPGSQTVWVAFDRAAAEALPVRLFSTSGQLLRSAIVTAGSFQLQLTVADLPPGMYAVQVGEAVRKLVVE
jgi:subtilisin-like proprotein convertase family protein